MDADEQRPRPELGVPGTSEAGARAAQEAACRAAHPSSRRPLASQDLNHDQPAAVHYERTAVRWLAAQGDRLARWPNGDEQREAMQLALGDVALLVGVRLRRGIEPLSTDYASLVTTLASVAARADSRELLRQDPQALLPLVTLQWALTAHGQPDPCLAQTLDIVLGEHSVLGLARTPHDQIALHFLLRQAGIDLPCPQLPDLLATSVLADDTVALELTPTDARALASIVIIGSDFGAAEILWPAGRTAAGVAGVLQEWLLLGMADEDPGLVGLLLTALTCLGTVSDYLLEAARNWLHGWQESDGRSDGFPYDTSSNTPEEIAWAAAMRTTAMTALDALLVSTPASRGSRPQPAVVCAMDTSALVDSIMAAADWLDAVLPGTHVAGRLWLSEAWLALGDDAEARRQLVRLTDDPHLAFTVLKQAPNLAVHLAALVVALNVTSPPLADLCDDVAALLSHPDAARQLFGGTAQPATGPADSKSNAAVRPDDQALALRTKLLCTDLLRHGPQHDPRSRSGVDDLLLLTRGAHRAVATGDVGWLAMTLRGLQRLELAPARILRDATAVLRSRQRADGALGARPAGDFRGSDDRQVRWTLATLTALVEALPPDDLPRAA